MRTKQIAVSLLTALLALLIFSCSDNEGRVQGKDLQMITREFISQYFPDNNIRYIEEVGNLPGPLDSNISPNIPIPTSAQYRIELEGNIYIMVAYDGNWLLIRAEDGLPATAEKIIDDKVLLQLKSEEPQAQITGLARAYEMSSTHIELNNKKLYVECYGFEDLGLGKRITETQTIPQTITDFLKRNNYYIDYGYLTQMTESKGIIYRFYANQGIVLSFNSDGEWIHGESNITDPSFSVDIQLNRIAKQEIPQAVMDELDKNSMKGELKNISCYENGYYGFRYEAQSFLFNKNGETVKAPNRAAEKIASYFKEGTSFLPPIIIVTSPYICWYPYVFGKDNKYFVSINTDINGQWLSINAKEAVDNNKAQYIDLPSQLLIDLLPPAILNYLEDKHKDEPAYGLAHWTEDEYVVGLRPNILLHFNAKGDFIKQSKE